MLIVTTYIGVSPIAGIGLFAAEFIPCGTVVWVKHNKFDMEVTKEELDRLPSACGSNLHTWKYLSPYSGKYVLCMDGARHFNHSDNPNTSCTLAIAELSEAQRAQLTDEQWADCDPHELVTVATRDIAKGEEITCDYSHDFPDPEEPTHAFIYNK